MLLNYYHCVKLKFAFEKGALAEHGVYLPNCSGVRSPLRNRLFLKALRAVSVPLLGHCLMTAHVRHISIPTVQSNYTDTGAFHSSQIH